MAGASNLKYPDRPRSNLEARMADLIAKNTLVANTKGGSPTSLDEKAH
ncbi:hypothetical protein V8V91_01675 [Algoriphagus halophilus]